ncbi:M48 family metallopeptidase [Desulfosediminicola flagellatus]|uniref:M48 family metallopeptidase n=1 Tax=Desulfosediminicola flagellatus TaxID=2569541 RepID=UPI0010ACFDD7|nr:M48 family metallopeptidase [Desulfosediminicola flagellatus]
MKYTPKQLEDNVNVSKSHPLVDLFWLTGGLVLIAGLIFLALGLATDLAVSKTPVNIENWLGKQALKRFTSTTNPPLQQRLNTLLASLPEDSLLHDYDFKIFLSETDAVNAIALPGGNIVVYSGLLREIKSENELAMVLYHELGHFEHRDHLRGLGRGLSLTLASVLLFGSDSAASEVVSKTLLTFQANYSQSQESAADTFGLDMLVAHYGHAGGATDFFSRLATQADNTNRLPYLLASHPHPQDRIDEINKRIIDNNYSIGTPTPLADNLKD